MGSLPVIRTRITDEYGLNLPIVSAGMTFVATAPIVAAVSNAGAMGTLGALMVSPGDLRKLIRKVRELTRRPFAVDFVTEFVEDAHVQVCLEEEVPVAVFFWALPRSTQVERLRQGGTRVWVQVSSVTEARMAVDRGADAVVVRGSDAAHQGGGDTTALSLTPAVVDAVAPVPVVACGGIVDGRGVVAALALGAEAAWCGASFSASSEALAHEPCRTRVRAASVEETLRMTLFGPEWPDQPLAVVPGQIRSPQGVRGPRPATRHSCPGPASAVARAVQVPSRSGTPFALRTRTGGNAPHGEGTLAGGDAGDTLGASPAREILARMGLDAVTTVRHRLDTIFAAVSAAR